MRQAVCSGGEGGRPALVAESAVPHISAASSSLSARICAANSASGSGSRASACSRATASAYEATSRSLSWICGHVRGGWG
eukprot:364766-Chlamydomonas_euryale.AAC.7